MEVRIGIAEVPRELILEIDETADTLEVMISDAIQKGRVVALVDSKGKRSIIPANKIAYVELGGAAGGSVGFR